MSVPAPVSAAKLSLTIERIRKELPDSSVLGSDPIAIIGIGCRLPGNIGSPEEFWNAIREGRDSIGDIPADRWPADDYYSDDPYEPGKMNTRRGGFLGGVDRFDPVFFGIAPREAAAMDPQHRLLLEVAWETLWDAGYAPGGLAGTSTGVFTAIYNTDYARASLASQAAIGPHTCAGIQHSMSAGRIAFLLDLRGPAVAIDTACSSSLVAVHLAVQSLRAANCRMALAGGVSIKIAPEHHLTLAKLGMLSPQGQCKVFDTAANGFVAGDGCAAVLLKRLSDALADGDRVHAVIRGSALNQDGRTSVITAPSGRAQQELVRAALANGRVRPEDVGFVETHGTGTALGDPIEVEALMSVLDTPGAPRCALGAVKSNLGHLEAAAGIVGLVKAALVLEREEIPPNLHFTSLNPHISLDHSRLYVPTTLTPWKRGGVPRFAGVSSFGFTGTNAHLVLEEAPAMPRLAVKHDVGQSAALLTISAKTDAALTE